MHKPTTLALAAAVVFSLSAPEVARADVASLYAQVQGGGAAGAGLFGDRKEASFFKGARGASYGAVVGLEFLFIDGWVEHNQYVDPDFLGTWTQFMVGFDVEVDWGERRNAETLEGGKKTGGYMSGYGEFGIATGFGVGTGQQVEPPLDNSEVTDKGFLIQANFGAGYRLAKNISLGVTVPIQGGYLFKSGMGATANNMDNQYVSLQASLMLNMRLKFQLK